MRRSARAWLVACCAAGLTLAGCAINPATGKRQISLIGERDEIQIGRENDKQIVASMGLYDDDELQRYVQQLGERMAVKSERPDLPWTFRVLDDPTVNAFALPGGFIYVTRGIMAHLNSEAELASVIGHEIGHVTARHGVNQMSKAQLAQLGFGLTMVLAPEAQQLGDLAQTGLSLLFLKYSRDDERQADDLGLRYLDRTGYDVRPMPNVFEVLRRVGESQGSGRVPGWMSTHPAPENRSARIDGAITALGRDFSGLPVNRETYYRQLDGIVFGENPREGFFKDHVFKHPDLEFRIDFPKGWKGVNQRQAVVAVSPEQDAIVQLSLATKPTTREALEAFFSQEGVSAGSRWLETINGYSASSRGFVAETQQGALQGVVAFVDFRDSILQLIGYTPKDAWGGHSDAITSSLSSFKRLTERAALSVQPKRLKVVDLRQNLSLPDFARRYDATVDVPTLALINHLDADARLRSGVAYKSIAGGKLP